MVPRPNRIIAAVLVSLVLVSLVLMQGPPNRALASPISTSLPDLAEFNAFPTEPVAPGVTAAAGPAVSSNTTHSVGRGGPEGECWRAIHVKPMTCKGIRKHCTGYGKGALDYIDIYYCSSASWRPVLVVLMAGWIALLFIWLGVSASDYFSPNISTVVKLLHLPESIAGVTLLAFGNGAPDLFGTYNAVKAGSGALAIGQLVGSASFITSVVVGATTLVVPAYVVNPMPYLRELWFFVAAVATMAVIIVTGQLTRVLALCMVGLYLLYAVTVVITTYYEHRLSDYFYGKAAIDVSENDEVPDVAIRLQHSPIAAPALVVSEPDDSLSLDHASLVHRGNDALTERAPSVAAESKEHDSEDDENPEQAFEEFLLYHRRSMLTAVELTDFMAALKAAREEARRQTLQAHNSMPMLGIHSGYLPAHTGDPAGAAESDGSDEYLETATPQAINCVDYSEFTTPTPTPPWSNYTMLPHTNILIERSPSHDSEMSVRPDSDSARSIRLAKSPILHLSPSVFRSEPNLLKKWIADQSAAQQAHAAVPPTPQIQIRPASANPPDRLVSRAASPEPCAPVEVEGPGQARRQDSGHSEQQQEQAVIPTIWVQPPTPLPPPRRKLHHPLDAADECPSSPKSASDRSSHSSSIASYTSSITSPHLSIVPHSFTRPSSNWSSVSARTSRGWRGRGIALLRCCIPTLRHWRADATVLRKFFIVYSAVPMLLLTLTVPVLTRPPPRPAKTSSQAVAPAFRMPATVDDDQSPMMEQAIQMGVQRQLQMAYSPKHTSSPDNRLPSHSESPACITRRCSLPSDCPVLLQPDESARLLPEHSDLVSYGANNHQEHLELHSRHMSLVSNRSKFVGHSFPTGISPTQSFSAASGFSFETNMSQGMWLAAVDPHQIVWAKRVMRYVCIAMTAMFLYCMLCRAMPQLLVIMPRAIGCVGVSTFLLLSICTYEHWVPDSYVIRVLPCFFGFLSGLSWIYLIADEIVAITQTLGLVMDISEEILGLTLVGFGNSVGDLVTNVTLATMGYPTMALAACFGGPMVNILLGVGMAAVSAMSHRGSNGDAVEIRISSKSIMVSTACLLFNTLVYVVIVPRQQYRMTRAVGLAAMAVYFVGMTVNVYSEL